MPSGRNVAQTIGILCGKDASASYSDDFSDDGIRHVTAGFASGVGANGSQTIGVGAVGGMLIGTFGLLFIVPALFVIFQALQEKFKPIVFKESSDPLILNELKLINEKNNK